MIHQKLADKNFVLSSNGFADGNAESLVEYFRRRGVRETVVIKHPLVKEGKTHHGITVYNTEAKVMEKKMNLPFYPPFTYPIDLLIPKVPIKTADVWFGFNNLNTLRGLFWRARGRVKKVIYCCVDFTPDRFGKETFATKCYNWLDRYCCFNADEIWTLSESSHLERMKYLNLEKCVPWQVVPMGAWLDRTPKVKKENYDRRELVFLGHILEKQGVQVIIEALHRLQESGHSDIILKVIGRGPYLENLHSLARSLGLEGNIKFLGYVESHEEIERHLASSSAAMATYDPEKASFTRYADPGKLKAYLAAGLPIILTNVSPNALELEEKGGGLIVEYTPESVAEKILALLGSRKTWEEKSRQALEYARQFDWYKIYDQAVERSNSFQSLLAR